MLMQVVTGRRRSRLGKGRGEFRWGHMFAAPWEVSIAGALIVQYLALDTGTPLS